MCGRFQLDVNDSEFRSIFKSLNYTPTNSVSESGDFTPSLFLPSLCLNRNDKRPQRNGFDKTFFPLRL